MVRKLSLVLICVLAVVITILASITYVYLYKKTEALNSSFPWCYNNWRCKAPSADLNIFNSLYPNICDHDLCEAGETYNALDKGPFSSAIKERCSAEGKELNDTNFVVVNKETGCRCLNGSTPCTVANLEANISGCDDHECGILPRSCGTYKIKKAEDPAVAQDIDQWLCDNNATGDVKDYCSFICPAPAKDSNIFFNKFIFGLRNDNT